MEQLKGTSTIDGLHVGHTEHEVETLLRFIKDTPEITKFVEIGIHVGGLTNLLRKVPNLHYLGIEISPYIIDPRVRDTELQFIFGDCFSPDTLTKVMLFLNGIDGAAILYCDNGNKPKELITYSPIARPGDYLLAHDFYDILREVPGLEGFGIDLEFPKPEVLPEDVEFLRNNPDFVEIDYFDTTRICAFKRI